MDSTHDLELSVEQLLGCVPLHVFFEAGKRPGAAVGDLRLLARHHQSWPAAEELVDGDLHVVTGDLGDPGDRLRLEVAP